MRIALTSDLHLGITGEKTIRRLLEDIAGEAPDLYINAGDYSGGFTGWKPLRQVVSWEMHYLPATPRISVLGNHDLWVRGRKKRGSSLHDRPTPTAFQDALGRIRAAFSEAGTHWLQECTPIQLGGYTFFGADGWYAKQEHTNDWNFLPVGLEGDTHAYLTRRFEDQLHHQLELLPSLPGRRVCITHQPIFYTEAQDRFREAGVSPPHGGRLALGDLLRKEWGVEYFINGHMHQRWEGPIRFEAGSDYYRPRYLIINLPDLPSHDEVPDEETKTDK